MGRIISVASGKGGVGKTTISCYLGQAFARFREPTVVVELDSGMRALDLITNSKKVVFDLDDVLQDRCELEDALMKPRKTLDFAFIAASAKYHSFPSLEGLQSLCVKLQEKYKNIILDFPAGYTSGQAVAQLSDLILMVVTPDSICTRDAALYTKYLQDDCGADAEKMRLIINRFRRDRLEKKSVDRMDKMIDKTELQLLGVIPDDNNLYRCTTAGYVLRIHTGVSLIFRAICRRINGADIPLICYR